MSVVETETTKQKLKSASAGDIFFELTALGKTEVVGMARINQQGRVFTLGENGQWRRFAGDRVSLENLFDLHPVQESKISLDGTSFPCKSCLD